MPPSSVWSRPNMLKTHGPRNEASKAILGHLSLLNGCFIIRHYNGVNPKTCRPGNIVSPPIAHPNKWLYAHVSCFVVFCNRPVLYILQGYWIDLLQKSHNTPVLYPTMHHFVTEMCTCVHISVTKWCILGYLSRALWNLWDGYIDIRKIVLVHQCKWSNREWYG